MNRSETRESEIFGGVQESYVTYLKILNVQMEIMHLKSENAKLSAIGGNPASD